MGFFNSKTRSSLPGFWLVSPSIYSSQSSEKSGQVESLEEEKSHAHTLVQWMKEIGQAAVDEGKGHSTSKGAQA